MGEAEVVIGSQELKVRAESARQRKNRKKRKEEEEEEEQLEEWGKMWSEDNCSSGSRNESVVRWDKLFPKMILRVLLVEADDSTRQIIAALFRKCSYEVVAVPDGLKAWEMLKGRPHNIDLILTEVDLPSISGYALLTLIMEHQICKNIPVIMMSSRDSISTGYKCMLRGAADYLVKPIRRNELTNLWQHVWRRQSSLAGQDGLKDESVRQDKVEDTSENNADNYNSNGGVACIQNNKKFIEKGSDAQSSCTKLDVETESDHMEKVRNILQPNWGIFFLNDVIKQKREAHKDRDQILLMHESEDGGSAVAACKDSSQMNMDEGVKLEGQRTATNFSREACDNNHVHVNSSREPIDFMGTSCSHNSSSDNAKTKLNYSPQLDLLLTRCHPSGFEIQVTDERPTLRHSNASAFTRYTSRSSQNVHSTSASFSNQKQPGATCERKLSSNVSDYNTDTPCPATSTERCIGSLANDQSKESEIAKSCAQQTVFPIQTQVDGISFNICASYGSMIPPTLCKQSGASPMVSPSSVSQLEPNSIANPFRQSSFRSNAEHLSDQFGQTPNDSANLCMQKQDHKLDSLEDRCHISPATDQSATSNFFNGAANHPNMGYAITSGGNINVDQDASVRAAVERKNEGVLHNANSHRSIQREAALTKFRLKRKDRCYEKKVRYESRKKLAEQRPRVKGQFVRQVHPLPAETEQQQHGSSIDG